MWAMSRLFMIALLIVLHSTSTLAHDFVATVTNIKPSVVGVGVYDPLAAPRSTLQGTGFVVGDGTLVVTNYHVVSKPLKKDVRQSRVIFTGSGKNPQTVMAEVIEIDPLHDLALLKIKKALPPLQLGLDAVVPDGTQIAFTGYPIGAVLGLYAATHTGIIAAYTPVITPSVNSDKLSADAIRRLRDPYFIYQLDATAYPGNSGSPVYDVETGKVVAIINKVFIKKTKESALTDPSGITYAIPVAYLKKMLAKLK